MQVIVDELAVTYIKKGSGSKTILLLHGWADSLETFSSLIKQLDADFCIVAIDLPGFGSSQLPNNTWTLDDYARFVGHFIDKTSIKPLAIVGHSNGGAIAIRGISHGYFSTERLVLIASSGVRSVNKLRKQTLKALAKPAKIAIKIAPLLVQNRIKKKLYGAIGSDFMVAENMRETFKNIVSADVVQDARKIAIPTLLLYGDEDTATPLAHGQLLQNSISNSRLVTIENSGHFLHQEQVYKVARLIKDFIK